MDARLICSVDHVYVDLAKLSDERITVLKSLFERYIDIANWYKPSVLVLDNLDRVISPEVEVRSHYLLVYSVP